MTEGYLNALNANDLYRTLGIHMQRAGEGSATSSLTPPPAVCWPFEGQVHGGILFTQMDTTMGNAVLSVLKSGDDCTTIHLDIQYVSRALAAPFTCTAWLTHRTRRVGFVRSEISDREGKAVAMGQGSFRIVRR